MCKRSYELTDELLPREAIALWLQQTGNGELISYAQDRDFVDELERTTSGFPLYLRFLMQELLKAQQEGSDVRSLLEQSPAEFGNYVQTQVQQLARQEEVRGRREIQTLLALLSVALGSLSESDLDILTGLTTWELVALPWQLTRWLSIQSNLYSFAHPLLAQEFQKALKGEAKKAQGQLLEYCEQWKEHHSAYALRHFPEHLFREESYEQLYELARDHAFLQAQAEAFTNEAEEPLLTLQRAIRGAILQDDAVRMTEFCLVHAQLVTKIRQESPLDALREGNLERAWKLANLHEIEYCILWYLLLMWELDQQNRLKDAQQTLKQLQKQKLAQLTSHWQQSFVFYLLPYVLKVDRDAFTTLYRQILDCSI